MFIPDPDLDFLPIPHHGSRIQGSSPNPASLHCMVLLVRYLSWVLTYTSGAGKYWEKGGVKEKN
jgi:hypothetical protein